MTRQYEESHKWISFRLDLSQSDYRFWLLLGECKSKIEHIAGVPLSPELSKRLHSVYLAKGVHATTAIEGNTLSEDQVRQAVEGKLVVMPSQEYLAQEVRNILSACNIIGEHVFVGTGMSLTPKLLKYFNMLVRHRLPPKPDCSCKAGEISTHGVTVGNVYRGAPREDCEYLLQRLCDWLAGPEFKSDLDPLLVAIIKSIVGHLYVAWIHPFCDGNGRTARLLEFLILLEAGLPSAAAHLLSNHYNATRDRYYIELARTSQSHGNILPFIFYAVEGLRDQLVEQIAWIRDQQIEIAWLRFVGEALSRQPRVKQTRQRALIEALGAEPVPMKSIPLLSPTVAREYAKVSASTLTRDITDLKDLQLIEFNEIEKTVRARREHILAFLPNRKSTIKNSSRARGRPRRQS